MKYHSRWAGHRGGTAEAGALHLAHRRPGSGQQLYATYEKITPKRIRSGAPDLQRPRPHLVTLATRASEGAGGGRGDAGRAPGSAPRGTRARRPRAVGIRGDDDAGTGAGGRQGAQQACSRGIAPKDDATLTLLPATGRRSSPSGSSSRRAPSTIRRQGRTRGAHRPAIGAAAQKSSHTNEASIASTEAGSIHAQPDREVTTSSAKCTRLSRRDLYQILPGSC